MNSKEQPHSYSTPQLSKEEESIFSYFIDEYNDLFPFIMTLSSQEFFSKLERKVQITLAPKNKAFPSGTMGKLSQAIKSTLYEPEYKIVKQLIQSIDNIKKCKRFSGSNYIPHCNETKEPLHQCGEKLFYFQLPNQKTYLMCLKCKLMYKSNCVLFHCSACNVDYYSAIDENEQGTEVKYQPATWVKYHCNAVVNDMMKCFKCREVLHVNQLNKKLNCLKCGFEAEQSSIKWKCLICHNEFIAEAKAYNPLEFKAMKMAVKNTLYDGKEAKPEYVPCCDVDVTAVKFTHKKECDGTMYSGILNKRAIVVCSKCHLLNYYENHFWMCVKCKERFKLPLKNKNQTPKSNSYNKKIANQQYPHSQFQQQQEDDYSSTPKEPAASQKNVLKRRSSEDHSRNDNNNPKRKGSQLLCYDAFKKSGSNVQSDSPNLTQFTQDNSKDPIKSISKFNVQLENNPNIITNDSQPKRTNNKRGPNININLNVNVNINNQQHNQHDDIDSSHNSEDDKVEKKEFCSDDYAVIKQIGEGTFGKIYAVENKRKVQFGMKKILANSIEEITALKTEYEILLSLASYQKLALVRIHGIESKKLDKTTYVMYVLMDLAIRDWEKEIERRNAKKNYYGEQELLKIIQELVSTFAELQKHNISHRDIKPQNILLFPDMSFRIADFGEAKEVIQKRNTLRQTIRGTELYMSPVLFSALQAKGNNTPKYTEHNTFKSDVFSFGLCVLLAASLSFNALYDIRELVDMISLKMVLNRYLKAKYSEKFIDLILSMLELNEKDRYDFLTLEKIILNMTR